jgi:hypothetical protein
MDWARISQTRGPRDVQFFLREPPFASAKRQFRPPEKPKIKKLPFSVTSTNTFSGQQVLPGVNVKMKM